MNSEHPQGANPPEVPGITPEEISRLPIRKYGGPVRLVATEHDLAQALWAIRGEKVVGIDTETRPAFKKGQSYLPSLVQIAGASAVYLFQLKKLDFSSALAAVLEDPALVKAGIGLADDFSKLKKLFPFTPQNAVDLSKVAQARGFKQSGVRSLSAQLLGFRITKSVATSNWARTELSPRQIEYAATDAWVCLELYHRFRQLGFFDSGKNPASPLQ